MGRPRTPTHILEMRGAFKKDPARGRARAGYADNRQLVQRRRPMPSMPERFQPVDGADTPKKRRLRDIWEEIEYQTRSVDLHPDNMARLDLTCELLWLCRYGRTATAEERALAGRWLTVLRMDQSYADRLVHRES